MTAEYFIILLLAVLLVVFVAVVFVFWRRLNTRQGETAIQLLQQQLADIAGRQDGRLGQLTDQLKHLDGNLNDRLAQSQNLSQQTQKFMTERLDTAGKTFAELKGQLGRLDQATRNILQVGTDVRQLQDILQSPKLRGGLGEWSLDNLLAEVLPHQHYQLQHRFRNGSIVDALVTLINGSITIDAKFPLTNFRQMLAAEDDASRIRLKRVFLRDVSKHIDSIAEKYILPDEGTLDFALMYIPAENVYYETTITTETIDLSAHARRRKVIPVSPNTLYVYLMAIANGLKGLQIEKNAREILNNIQRLNSLLSSFSNDFNTVGKHLQNAYAKHEEASKKLDRFEMQLGQLELPCAQCDD